MRNNKKIIAVLPAYNAAKTLQRTLSDIPREWIDEIILVDDASSDGTADLARSLGLITIEHPQNRGYGGNQKTCYAAALARGADIVIMVHPDHQYDPTKIPSLLLPIINGQFDAVFGSRLLQPGGPKAGGMPLWKLIANRGLTTIENRVLGLALSEYHSGFRAYSAAVLRTLQIEKNSDDFVFDTEIIIQMAAKKFRIGEVPIPTRYFKEASMIGLGRSMIYGLGIIKALGHYRLHTSGLKKSDKF